MRLSIPVGAVCALTLASAAPVWAKPVATVTVKTYPVRGETGIQLFQSIGRNGPRHGLFKHAVAQTTYSVEWATKTVVQDGVCRLASAQPSLKITFIYPNPANPLTPSMTRSWNRFMIGVRRHEETHAAIARKMTAEALRRVRGLHTDGDPSCRKLQKELKRRANEVYTSYEERQERFDADQHRPGGAIDRLLIGLATAT